MHRPVLLVTCLLVTLVSLPAAAQSVDLVTCLPGVVDDVAVAGPVAFCAARSGLLVLDLAASPDPAHLAFLPLENAAVVAAAGPIVFVGGQGWIDGGLVVVDAGDPRAPAVIATLPGLTGIVSMVTVDDLLVVGCAGPPRLVVLDVHDPQQPESVGWLDLVAEPAGLAIQDQLLYVAARSGGLRIVDIGDPTAPLEVGSYATACDVAGVAVAGGHAYLACRYFALVVVDVADPQHPEPVGWFQGTGYGRAWEIAVVGDHAYLPLTEAGLADIDVSDPTDPIQVAFCAFAGRNRAIAHDGDRLYVGSGFRGLHVVDVAEPGAPVVAGLYGTVGDAVDPCARGDLVYLGGGSFSDAKSREGLAGLVTVDLALVAHPHVTDFLPVALPALAVEAADATAFVLDYFGRLYAADLADPAHPILVSTCDLPETGEDLAIADDVAYAACGPGGLRIVDVADPAAMIEIAQVPVDEHASGVAVHGTIAYVTELYGHVYTVDVADPAAPVVLDVQTTPSYAEAVAWTADRLLVAGGATGLLVFDASDPAHPAPAGVHDTPGYAADVAVDGLLAAVADRDGGVRFFDVTVPDQPVEVAAVAAARGADTVAFGEAGLILAGARLDGLYVLGLTTTIGSPATAAASPGVSVAPNPCNPAATITFEVPRAGPVAVKIHDLRGRVVRTLLQGEVVPPGPRSVAWDGRDGRGRPLPAGMYVCRVTGPWGSRERKLTVIK